MAGIKHAHTHTRQFCLDECALPCCQRRRFAQLDVVAQLGTGADLAQIEQAARRETRIRELEKKKAREERNKNIG